MPVERSIRLASVRPGLMAKDPNGVRVVVRYAPFHQGSDKVIGLLEASRRQGKYEAVLQAVLAAQPM
jgi:hypothetical protein